MKHTTAKVSWGIQGRRIAWFQVRSKRPSLSELKKIEALMDQHGDEIFSTSNGRQVGVAINTDGGVYDRDITLTPDGVELKVPALVFGSKGIPAGSLGFHGNGVKLFVSLKGKKTFTLRGKPIEAFLLPRTQKALDRWLAKNESGLKKHRKIRSLGTDLYIRFGTWGSSSKVFLNEDREDFNPSEGFDRRYEAGVSVYQAKALSNGGFEIQPPNSKEAIYSIGGSYLTDMVSKMRHRDIFLLKGDWVKALTTIPGTDIPTQIEVRGADGEPVLESDTIKKIAKLAPDQVYLPSGESVSQLWKGKSASPQRVAMRWLKT